MPSSATSLFCWLLLMSIAEKSESKTVVFIPTPFPSHTMRHVHVARALAERDHQVWVAMAIYLSDKRHLDTSGIHIIPYETVPELQETAQKIKNEYYFEGKSHKLFEYAQLYENIQDTILRNDSFIKTIGEKNPDLIVIEHSLATFALGVIPYRLGTPFAYLSHFYDALLMGVPFSPAEVPLFFHPYSNKMAFNQRLYTTLIYLWLSVCSPTNPVTKYAPEMRNLPLSVLVKQAEIFLVEIDHILDYPKPTLPNVKLIGGTVAGPAKALLPEFQSFMDSAKEGVVIVSFGSYVLHLPERIGDKVLKVLLQLPMKSVFRSNLTSPDPEKILTAAWIPQNDLLGHPHTRVLVSHCGTNGQYEALYHAVPVVATPLFGDQPYNAERVRSKGFAEVLDLNTCTIEQMKSAILTVANEPRYKQAVIQHSRLFRELYGVPRETAAYWLDHVMEYGGEYMRSAGQQMPFYQFMLLDVCLCILCVLMLVVGLICGFICAICGYFRSRKMKPE